MYKKSTSKGRLYFDIHPPLKMSTSSSTYLIPKHKLKWVINIVKPLQSSAEVFARSQNLMLVRARMLLLESSLYGWYGLRRLTWNTGWIFIQVGGSTLYVIFPIRLVMWMGASYFLMSFRPPYHPHRTQLAFFFDRPISLCTLMLFLGIFSSYSVVKSWAWQVLLSSIPATVCGKRGCWPFARSKGLLLDVVLLALETKVVPLPRVWPNLSG